MEVGREMLDTRPVSGELVEWDGEAGWIQPNNEIDHPLATENEGRVFFMAGDVSGTLPDIGGGVSFRTYTDGHILGAMHVRPETKARGSGNKGGAPNGQRPMAVVSRPGRSHDATNGHSEVQNNRKSSEPTFRGAKGDKFGKFGKGSCGKGCGYGKPMAAQFGYGMPAYGYAPPAVAAAPAFASRQMGYGTGLPVYGGGYGSVSGAQSHGEEHGKGTASNWKKSKKERSAESRAYNALYEEIWSAVESVLELEPDWDQGEFAKRILRYFSKATQAPEALLRQQWTEAVRQIVETAMHGYSAACGEKAWFFDLNLAPALGKASWEIVQSGDDHSSCTQPDVEELAAAVYDEVMDGILLEKAAWAVIESVFEDVEEKTRTKIFRPVTQTRKAALKVALDAPQDMDDSERIEAFMQKWIEDSMEKAWRSCEEILTDEAVTQMFLGLIAPFGEEHPFSGVPAILTINEGRPSTDWAFVEPTVSTLFAEWREPAEPSNKKRKKGKADAEEEYDPEAEELGGL